jgi:hypothetical protein
MKCDNEIKQWIDEREVLTKNELSRYMFNCRTHGNQRLRSWWNYVLETKDWAKLKEYNELKNRKGQPERFKKFVEIYNNDSRFAKLGKRYTMRLLLELYDFKLSLATAGRYLREIRQTTDSKI